ncbi:MAG: beta-ketoacyl-ACP synthase 3, partial [Alphaproteobacteria bacterium]|nr:beta-ketoacyl-ACP synthase 3 [Alphaproteobacteria bacterium]
MTLNINPQLLGIGCAIPEKIVTNDDLTGLYETSDEWIYSRTGIKERRVFQNNEEAFDLLKKAAFQALANAGVDKNEIDLIIAATSMPVQFMPSTSCMLQKLLEVKENIPAFDIAAACSGFVYGLNMATAYIKSGIFKKILLVTIDNCSRYVDWHDRRTSILFGDGIGAAVIGAGERNDIEVTDIKADGSIGEYITMPAQLGNSPFCNQEPQAQICTMAGQDVYKFAVSTVPSYVSDDILKRNNIDPQEVDYLVLHQANQRIIKAV